MSKTSQFVFIHFLWILNMSDSELSSFGKIGKSIILPARFLFEDKCFFEKNYKFVICFALWANDFHTSDTNVPAVLSNSHCTWPDKVFGRKFSWKKTAFNFFLNFEQNVSRLSAVCFQRLAFLKIHFSILEENVGVKNCLKNKGYSFLSQYCEGGFGNSDKDVESVFSQLLSNRVEVSSVCFHPLSVDFEQVKNWTVFFW